MEIPLHPIGVPRRADGVFEQLRSRILSGDLAAGERLPNERELAGLLAVNRASVREAVKRLEFLELVDVRHGQGTFVREVGDSSALQVVENLLREPESVTRELLEQILLFRRHITLQVVELAARNHNAAHIEQARAMLARERECADDPAAALALDVELNRLLGEATGNLMYQLVSNLFTKLLKRLGPLYYNARRNSARSVETHRELFAALEARDVPTSRAILERMLDYSETAILHGVQRLEVEGLIGPGARSAAPGDLPT